MSAVTIRFPKPMKRGAKVKKGPMAAIIRFPARHATVELAERWYWLLHNSHDWENEELSGPLDDHDRKIMQAFQQLRVSKPVITASEMKAKIASCEDVIRQRTCAKDLLERLGVDWDEVRTPEQALFFLADYVLAPKYPASA